MDGNKWRQRASRLRRALRGQEPAEVRNALSSRIDAVESRLRQVTAIPAPLAEYELVHRLQGLVRARLWAQVVVGMIAGIAFGMAISPDGLALVPESVATPLAEWLSLPGQIFLALVQMMMIPLIVASVALGISSTGDPGQLKRMLSRIGPYFVATTTAAVLIGSSLALVIQPGQFIDADTLDDGTIASQLPDDQLEEPEPMSLPEQIVGLIPTDPLAAALDRSMLQIVVFSILIGAALIAIPEQRAGPITSLASSTQEVALQVVSWAMRLAPFAVFGLLAQLVGDIGFDAITTMSAYVGTVLLGLLLLVVSYLVIVAIVARVSPIRFLLAAKEVQLLAFSTSSSAAVMPLSLQTAEQKLGVRASVARFVVPVGATVNMDGTALYQVTAAVFLTQVFNIDLSVSELLLLTATIVGASIGSPGTPGVGIVILATVLGGIGIPAAGLALIIGVDRVLDMSRTAVNVTGDLTACLVMERWTSEPKPEPEGAPIEANAAGTLTAEAALR